MTLGTTFTRLSPAEVDRHPNGRMNLLWREHPLSDLARALGLESFRREPTPRWPSFDLPRLQYKYSTDSLYLQIDSPGIQAFAKWCARDHTLLATLPFVRRGNRLSCTMTPPPQGAFLLVFGGYEGDRHPIAYYAYRNGRLSSRSLRDKVRLRRHIDRQIPEEQWFWQEPEQWPERCQVSLQTIARDHKFLGGCFPFDFVLGCFRYTLLRRLGCSLPPLREVAHLLNHGELYKALIAIDPAWRSTTDQLRETRRPEIQHWLLQNGKSNGLKIACQFAAGRDADAHDRALAIYRDLETLTDLEKHFAHMSRPLASRLVTIRESLELYIGQSSKVRHALADLKGLQKHLPTPGGSPLADRRVHSRHGTSLPSKGTLPRAQKRHRKAVHQAFQEVQEGISGALELWRHRPREDWPPWVPRARELFARFEKGKSLAAEELLFYLGNYRGWRLESNLQVPHTSQRPNDGPLSWWGGSRPAHSHSKKRAKEYRIVLWGEPGVGKTSALAAYLCSSPPAWLNPQDPLSHAALKKLSPIFNNLQQGKLSTVTPVSQEYVVRYDENTVLRFRDVRGGETLRSDLRTDERQALDHADAVICFLGWPGPDVGERGVGALTGAFTFSPHSPRTLALTKVESFLTLEELLQFRFHDPHRLLLSAPTSRMPSEGYAKQLRRFERDAIFPITLYGYEANGYPAQHYDELGRLVPRRISPIHIHELFEHVLRNLQ